MAPRASPTAISPNFMLRPKVELRQHLVRPLAVHRNIGKPLLRRKGRAGIDDRDVISGRPGEWNERLGEMHRTDDDQVERRIVDVDEILRIADLDRARAV